MKEITGNIHIVSLCNYKIRPQFHLPTTHNNTSLEFFKKIFIETWSPAQHLHESENLQQWRQDSAALAPILPQYQRLSCRASNIPPLCPIPVFSPPLLWIGECGSLDVSWDPCWTESLSRRHCSGGAENLGEVSDGLSCCSCQKILYCSEHI